MTKTNLRITAEPPFQAGFSRAELGVVGSNKKLNEGGGYEVEEDDLAPEWSNSESAGEG